MDKYEAELPSCQLCAHLDSLVPPVLAKTHYMFATVLLSAIIGSELIDWCVM